MTFMGAAPFFSDEQGKHNIKKVLGYRYKGQTKEYLIQIKGEPSQNSIWVSEGSLEAKAKKAVKVKHLSRIM